MTGADEVGLSFGISENLHVPIVSLVLIIK